MSWAGVALDAPVIEEHHEDGGDKRCLKPKGAVPNLAYASTTPTTAATTATATNANLLAAAARRGARSQSQPAPDLNPTRILC